MLPAMKVPHTEWFHSDCLANYYGEEVFSEEYWRIVENFVKTAGEASLQHASDPDLYAAS